MWANVPQRNKYFVGRGKLLDDLHHRITSHDTRAVVLPHALQGLGGVGKTQLAVEYTHRHRGDYDVVAWIPAHQPVLARTALAALAPRLGHTAAVAVGRLEDAVQAVLDALRRGDPFERWLLVFDNAGEPESINDLLPQGSGHLLVTSRNRAWVDVADAVEVDVFSRAESLEFLQARVPGIGEADADMLAEVLGDLPLALAQAGALLAEMAMPAATYLEQLKYNTQILGENRPADYPYSVAVTWSLAMQHLREGSPDAMDLLRRCAFFSTEPIPLGLFSRGQNVFDPPLRDTVSDPILMGRAVRALGRYSLANVNHRDKTIQVHPIIQMLVRDSLDSETQAEVRREVQRLLEAVDPDDPDNFASHSMYRDLLAQISQAGVMESSEPAGRRLARNIVRYLFTAGDYTDAKTYAQQALDQWIADSDETDRDVLVMKRHLGTVLFQLGEYRAAYNLNQRTLDGMRKVLGKDHEETLILVNLHAADMRARGDFTLARKMDEDSVARHRQVFGEDHPRTFMAANNLALDYRIHGKYQKALELQDQNYRDRLNFYGSDNDPQVLFALDGLARSLRHVGDYEAAWEMAERVYREFQELARQSKISQDHLLVLTQAKSLSVDRRKMGKFNEALKLAREVHERYQRRYGVNHPDTLAAAVSLGNAERLAGNLNEAAARIGDAVQHYRDLLGTDHPYTLGAVLNLAIARRRLGDPAGVKELLVDTLASLAERVGRDHDYVLSAATNLASVLADLGEAEQARELGEDTLRRFRTSLGEDNPHTLACAANLALDMRASRQEDKAVELLADTMARYRRTLGEDHPDTRAVTQQQRLDVDFDPPPI